MFSKEVFFFLWLLCGWDLGLRPVELVWPQNYIKLREAANSSNIEVGSSNCFAYFVLNISLLI